MGVKTYLKTIFPGLEGNKKLWRDWGESKHIKLNWGDVTSQPDFPEKFLRLIKGLDDKSVSTVTRILARQKRILSSNEKYLDLFTEAEQQELRELKENFYDEIIRLSDNLFVWRNYLLPIKYHDASVLYYKHGIDKVETIARVRGKTIIDVGGYIGDSALVFEELEPDKIYTFEPSPGNFELIKRTIELNDLKNVTPENFALGAEKGEISLFVSGACSGVLNRGFNYQSKTKIPVMTLDEYVAEHKIENIGLIKVDIEGAEPDFLAGAKKTICAQKPILMICIYHSAHDFFELKPLIESWDLGYKFKINKPTIHDIDDETMLIAEII